MFEHFTDQSEMNTTSRMVLIIMDDAWEHELNYGDELGITCPGGKLIGHSIYQGGNTGVIISGDDHHTTEKEAIARNEEFFIYVWNTNTNIEKPYKVVSWLQGNELYEDNKISIAGKLHEHNILIDFDKDFIICHPNPANNLTEISIGITLQSEIELCLLDINGKLIETIDNTIYEKGLHKLWYDTSKLRSGIYIISLSSEYCKAKTKLVIVR